MQKKYDLTITNSVSGVVYNAKGDLSSAGLGLGQFEAIASTTSGTTAGSAGFPNNAAVATLTFQANGRISFVLYTGSGTPSGFATPDNWVDVTGADDVPVTDDLIFPWVGGAGYAMSWPTPSGIAGATYSPIGSQVYDPGVTELDLSVDRVFSVTRLQSQAGSSSTVTWNVTIHNKSPSATPSSVLWTFALTAEMQTG